MAIHEDIRGLWELTFTCKNKDKININITPEISAHLRESIRIIGHLVSFTEPILAFDLSI